MLRAPTHTRISLALDSARLSAEYAKIPCDGAVLRCAEPLAQKLGVHPRKLLANGAGERLIELYSGEIFRVARDFAPRPVAYRTLDLSADEYARLEGGGDYRENVQPGLRGCSRYLAEEESFRLELRAIKRARDMGCVNLDLLLPPARTAEELASCREIVIEEGLFASAEFELWMTAEAPPAARVEDFLPLVAGVSIEFSGPAPLAAITSMAQACRARGVACSIWSDLRGHSPERRAEIFCTLLEAGVTGWMAGPEEFEKIAGDVARAESALGIPAEREVAK